MARLTRDTTKVTPETTGMRAATARLKAGLATKVGDETATEFAKRQASAMKKIPNVTGVSEVLAMDPETFIWKVDNTKAQGGYEMSQLRKIAEDAGIDTKLARPQLAEALKLWYGSQNNPTTTLTAEELQKITGESIGTTDTGEFLDMRFDAAESYRREMLLNETSLVKNALVS